MRQLFLLGGVNDNLEVASRSFVAAAGGEKARIALLLPVAGGRSWERYVPYCQEPWSSLGVQHVVPIAPAEGSTELSAEQLEALAGCTGIFMAGGDTRAYHAVYAQGAAREVLRDVYRRGVPYAGLSAGALLTPDSALIWGDRLTTATNQLCLRGSEDECEEELLIGPGLGFLPNVLVECHFSEQGGFPRLIAGLEQTGAPVGLGIDDQMVAEVRDEQQVHIHGVGRVYLVKRQASGSYELTVMEPGQSFPLPFGR